MSDRSLERVFISIGSNIDPERHLQLAVQRLRNLGNMLALSTVYESPAYLPDDHPAAGKTRPFLNTAALLLLELDPLALRTALKAIEADLGRVRTDDPYAPRQIDLDIALYGSRLMTQEGLTLPDPEIVQRAFLAVPLSELDPHFKHPLTGEPLQVIADRLRPSGRLIARPEFSLKLQSLLEDA